MSGEINIEYPDATRSAAQASAEAKPDAPAPAAAPGARFSIDQMNATLEGAPGKDAGMYASMLSGFASDGNERVRMLADQLFPGKPVEESVKRFTTTPKGKIIYRADDGNYYDALPESGVRGMAADVLKGAGPALPVAGSALAGAVTLPLAATGVGLAATVGAAGAGGVGGEVLRQKLGDVLLGRASTGALNVPEVIKQGVEGAAGQGIGVGMTSMVGRHAVADISRYNEASTRQAYANAANIGVDITPAEATGLASLKWQQKRLGNIPTTSDDMAKFIDGRNQQVIGAWDRLLNSISPKSDAEEVGKLVRDTAQGVLKDMRTKLQAEAAPFYKAAYAKDVPVTPELEGLLKRPIMQDAMAKAEELMLNDPNATTRKFFMARGADGKFSERVAIPNMEQWDYVKRGLDALLDSPDAVNAKTGGTSNWGRIVGANKRELLDKFDNPKSASYVPEYGQARRIYSGGAEDITTAMESALKIIAETKDVDILRAAQHTFNSTTRSPDMVTKLRTALEAKSPQAWQAIKRLHMQDITTKALQAAEVEDIANPAGKIYKAFSNAKVSANLMAAMDDTEKVNYREMLSVFRRASSVKMLGSDTEWNRIGVSEAQDKARPWFAKVVGVVQGANPVHPNFLGIKPLQDFLTDRNLAKQANQMMEIITSGDPEGIKKLRELRKLSLSSKQGIVALGHLLERGAVLGGSAYFGSASADEAEAPPQQ